MRTFIKTSMIILFMICIALLAVKANALEVAADDYATVYEIVGADGGGYELYRSNTVTDGPVFCADRLSEIIELIRGDLNEGEIVFSDIVTDEKIAFTCGNYRLSGKIEFVGDGGFIIEGANLKLRNILINIENGHIRLKDGYLLIENAFINSKKTAIKVDCYATALLEMTGGEIVAFSESSAIEISYGTVKISGGTVRNTAGPAIVNGSTLVIYKDPQICGIDCDVFAKSPITLTQGNEKFIGECRVKCDKIFEKGKICLIAYGATHENERNIRLFDSHGTEQRVKYYENHPDVAENHFLTAYLPYEIRFLGESEEIQYKLEGEKIEPPLPTAKDGYEFIGWKIGNAEGESLEVNATATKDEKIYPVYKLKAPAFSLFSMEFVYDENGRYLSLENLYHPLMSEGIISYKWYKDGEELFVYGDKILIKNTSDSGKYKCTFTFSHKSESVTVETPEVSVLVRKSLISVPQIPEVEYDGQMHAPKVQALSTYGVFGQGGISAGEYPVTLTVTDSQNYGFFPDGAESVVVNFVISKARNEWAESPSVNNSYSWETLKTSAIAKFGDVRFFFSDRENGSYSEVPPDSSGAYYMKATVYETENYFGIESPPIRFEIIEDEISSLYIVNDANQKHYKAFERFDIEGLSVCARYMSGREELILSEDINIAYHNGNTVLFGDGSVIISYRGKSLFYPVVVSKAEYDLTAIVFEDCVYEYSGAFIAPTFSSPLPIGLDGTFLRAEVIGGGTNAGDYVVELRFYTDSENYLVPDSVFATMRVSPKSVEIIWESLSFVYDGKLKSPIAYFFGINGEKVFLGVNGGRSFVGVYEVSAEVVSKNYTAVNTVAEFEILPADYDLSGIFWSASGFIYNGEEQSVILNGLPDGVTVVGYSDNRATEVGVYIAGVTLSYDTRNYNAPKISPYEWQIFRAEYDLSGVEFLSAEFVYDGSEHFPILSGELPVGKDGSLLSYSFSGGAVNVSDGKVLVKVSFTSTGKNYNTPEDIYCFVSVLPLEIDVEWEKLSAVYNGEAFAPSATSDECEIIVTGAQSDAGRYTAVAKSLDRNYTVKNAECEFEILKANNAWSVLPSISDIFASQALNGIGAAQFGESKFFYSCNKSEIIIPPTSHGVYYFKVESEGDKNHLPITSEWIRFEIFEVIPIAFFVEMKNRDYLTLDKLEDEDFSAYVRNNDSSVVKIPFWDIKISYGNGECFSLYDASVGFSYLSFYEVKEIRVFKRDYDLSGVFWEGLRTVYDGNEKRATVHGLPEGVEVVSYIGNASVNAGMYVVSVKLRYDEANYNEPILPDVIMTVEKETVIIPDIENGLYTSMLVFPAIEPSELYCYDFSGAVDAGEYKIIFRLYDTENYTFEGNLSVQEKKFVIDKIKLKLQISDIEKYLFGKYSEPEIVILEGSLAAGEALDPIYEIGENTVFAVFDNKNYEIEVVGGKINSYRRLSPEDTKTFMFLSISALFAVITIALMIVNRKRILRFYKSSFMKKDGFVPSAPTLHGQDVYENSDDESIDTQSLSEEIADDTFAEEDAESGESSEECDCLDVVSHPSAATVIDAGYADSVITDSLARNLIRRENEIKTNGNAKNVINVDTLCRSFSPDDRVDINILKRKSLIPYDTGYIKVLARGIVDKPLTVYANDFSLSAVKMIALAGGKSIKVTTSFTDDFKFRKKT